MNVFKNIFPIIENKEYFKTLFEHSPTDIKYLYVFFARFPGPQILGFTGFPLGRTFEIPPSFIQFVVYNSIPTNRPAGLHKEFIKKSLPLI